MNACELTASITAIANWLACRLTQEQLELLDVSLTQLGDALLTIATQKSICCKPKSVKNIVRGTDAGGICDIIERSLSSR